MVAASVSAASGSGFVNGTAGETITAGQLVYLKASDGRYWLCDADSSLETATAAGFALHGSLAGQPLKIHAGGELTLGTTVFAIGDIVLSSDTAGGIRPAADVDIGDWITVVGIAKTVAVLNVTLNNSGYQKVA